MLYAFLRWWGRQLWSTLPAAWRQALAGRRDEDALLLALTEPRSDQGPTIEAERRTARRSTRLGRFTLDAPGLDRLRAAVGRAPTQAIRLLLPPALVLEQQVTMPLAAEAGLDTALRWELDRLTPFQADSVFWNWQVAERDRARGRLLLTLRLVPKMAVGGIVDALTAAGLAPTLLAPADDPARTIPLQLRTSGRRHNRMLNLAAALCVLLLAAAVAAPFLRQDRALADADARIEALRPTVTLADGLRRRLSDRAANAGIIAAESERVGNTLRMLATITDLLPDDTFLFGLTLKDRVLTITGQSAAAAKLIPALASDPSVRDPVFTAPVTRSEQNGAETFTLQARMQP